MFQRGEFVEEPPESEDEDSEIEEEPIPSFSSSLTSTLCCCGEKNAVTEIGVSLFFYNFCRARKERKALKILLIKRTKRTSSRRCSSVGRWIWLSLMNLRVVIQATSHRPIHPLWPLTWTASRKFSCSTKFLTKTTIPKNIQRKRKNRTENSSLECHQKRHKCFGHCLWLDWQRQDLIRAFLSMHITSSKFSTSWCTENSGSHLSLPRALTSSLIFWRS